MFAIQDLFGNIGKPMADIRDDPENAADGFLAWWAAWPAHDRKAEKRRCMDFWVKHGLARHQAHVMAYTAHMLDTPQYKNDDRMYLPAPLVFLRKEGWIDWQAPARKALHAQTNTTQVTAEHKLKAVPAPESARAMLAAMRRKV